MFWLLCFPALAVDQGQKRAHDACQGNRPVTKRHQHPRRREFNEKKRYHTTYANLTYLSHVAVCMYSLLEEHRGLLDFFACCVFLEYLENVSLTFGEQE